MPWVYHLSNIIITYGSCSVGEAVRALLSIFSPLLPLSTA